MTEHKNTRAIRLLDASVFLAVVIAIAVVVNVLLALPSAPTLRVDLTEEGLYTLSPASQALVAELPEEIVVKLFISENLQYPDHNLEQRVADLLTEYRAHANGRLRFEIIHPDEAEGLDDLAADPNADPDAAEPPADPGEDGPRGFGIQKIPVGVRGDDQVGLRLVYKGMALLAGDRTEVIKEIRGTDNLEYEISKRIKLLVTPEEARHQVGFVAGFGGPVDSPQFLQGINGAFSQIYGDLLTAVEVRPGEQEIPATVDALVILNPNQPFSPAARYRVDQFIMGGKGVAWLQTGLASNPQMPMLPMRQPVHVDLAPLFKAYGLELNSDVVLDRQSNIVGLAFTSRGLAQVSNPTMPIFTDIHAESIITRDVPMLSFPLASSLTVTPPSPEVEVIELVRSEPEAVRRTKLDSVDYDKIATPQPDETPGPFVMAAALQGALPSAFAGQPAPEGVSQEGRRDRAEAGARVVVVGNGDFMFPNPQTGFSQQYASLGALFLLNTMDWMVQDDALISIRSKGIPRIVTEVKEEQHAAYQLGNVLGVPALFGLVGVAVWALRRQRRAALKLT